jgi:hypothetical protein
VEEVVVKEQDIEDVLLQKSASSISEDENYKKI